MGKLTGIIIFYLENKGYGYLRLMNTREEFHFRAKNTTSAGLRKGDLVKFTVKESKQGCFADEITLAGIA